jgi:uncharacterized membrane protein (UPF0127 family)/CheY-like chemotaxis protein
VKREPNIIVNLTRGTIACDHAAIADRALPRMRGLLGRGFLLSGEGLLLQPAASVHTAFMRFPIDVVFLDRNQRVVKLVERMGAWRTASARHARSTLELPAGEAAARGIQVGDTLAVVVIPDDASELKAWSHERDLAPIRVRDTRHAGNHATGEPSIAATDSVDRVRVLLVGKDRRFRAVAGALLTRRGCSVALAEGLAKIGELVERTRPEVVVIDAGSSLTAAARTAARIQTLALPVGVVVVGDERVDRLSAMRVLEKWGSFDELYSAIANARPSGNRRSSNGHC